MLGILQREYGITRQQALWEYSFDELQVFITELPFERIVKVHGSETKAELERKWLESVADFDDSKIREDKEDYDKRVKIMELKSNIKKEKNGQKKKNLQVQLEKLLGE
jgi:hypothetical protein